jgi:hypothetical protein
MREVANYNHECAISGLAAALWTDVALAKGAAICGRESTSAPLTAWAGHNVPHRALCGFHSTDLQVVAKAPHIAHDPPERT